MQSTELNSSTSDNNQPPWPPIFNRETRRKCAKDGHDRFETIDGITACIGCGYVKE